jgi:hypothetical protein
MGRKKKNVELSLFSEAELAEMIVDSMPEEATIEKVEDDGKLSNATIIRNISYDQTEILHNIARLYNDGNDQFDCDMTASSLGFYGDVHGGKYNIPEPKILMDVFPQREDIIKIERWGKLPLEDNSIHSLVIDLPFVISPELAPSAVNKKEGSSLIYNRFAGYYPVDNLYLSYYHWLSEAYRVLDKDGICIFKCQSCISGGIRHNIEEFSFMAAQRLGFKMEDKFTLLAKARLISPNKYKNGQQHSRSYTSQFLVFIKDTRKRRKKDFFFEDMLDRCETESEEGFVNVVEK